MRVTSRTEPTISPPSVTEGAARQEAVCQSPLPDSRVQQKVTFSKPRLESVMQRSQMFRSAVGLASAPAFVAQAEVVEIRAALVEQAGGIGVEYRSGDTLVGRSTDAAPAGVELLLPGVKPAPVQFRTRTVRRGIIELGPAKMGALTLLLKLVQKTPSLVERTLEVHADEAQRFAVTFPLDLAIVGEFASFSGPEKARTLCDTVRGSARTETFPVGMVRASGKVYGLAADSRSEI